MKFIEGFRKVSPFKNMSIRQKMLFYFIFLLVPALAALGTFSYLRAQRAIMDNVSKYVTDMLKQTSNTIDCYFQEADNLVASIIFDRAIRESMYESQKGEYELAKASYNINQLLMGMTYPRKYAKQFYIVDRKGVIFSSNNNVNIDLLKQQSWFEKVYTGKVKKLIVPPHNSEEYTQGQVIINIGMVVTVLREYNDIERNKTLGVIALDLDYNVIKQNFQNLNVEKDNGDILLTDETGTIVYYKDISRIGMKADWLNFEKISSQDQGSYTCQINGENTLVVYTTSSLTHCKTIEAIPVKSLMKYAADVKSDTVIIGLVCILLSIFFAFIVSYSISSPVHKLKRKMKLVEEGNLDVNMEVTSNDEVGQLTHSFNQMVREIKSLIDKIYEKEKEKRQIELQMLQQQINPHFLYNTLDSINWMARMQNASNISSSITALIKLLRMSIHNGDDFNTIRDEMECLHNYVEIQKFRYSDKLEVRFDIAEEIMDYRILKLLLQPLLENAIFHGLDSDQDTGIIKLSGRLCPEYIEICVEDYGKGMTPEEIEKVIHSAPQRSKSFSGIGIANIIQRIKLYYGENYGLSYESEPGKGLKAKLVIPLLLEKL